MRCRRVGGGGVQPGVGERAERLGQGDDLGGQLDSRRGLGHQAVEAEPGSGFGEGAFVPGVLNNVHLGVPSDSGLGGCTAVSDTHQVAAANYPRIRAESCHARAEGDGVEMMWKSYGEAVEIR